MKMTGTSSHRIHFDHPCEIIYDCVVQSCTDKSNSDGRIRPNHVKDVDLIAECIHNNSTLLFREGLMVVTIRVSQTNMVIPYIQLFSISSVPPPLTVSKYIDKLGMCSLRGAIENNGILISSTFAYHKN